MPPAFMEISARPDFTDGTMETLSVSNFFQTVLPLIRNKVGAPLSLSPYQMNSISKEPAFDDRIDRAGLPLGFWFTGRLRPRQAG
jgi:hypothetical protein